LWKATLDSNIRIELRRIVANISNPSVSQRSLNQLLGAKVIDKDEYKSLSARLNDE
jgi:hypothetical protein